MVKAYCRTRRWIGVLLAMMLAAGPSKGQTPATTTVSDVVYRADGAPASGIVLISWPSFSTADNKPVAAGSKSVVLGSQGRLNVELVPNADAIPAGTLYRVTYHLDGGNISTEFWSVGTSSPTSIAAVRTTLGEGTAASISRQYLDAALAGKANDAAVVHKTGSEVIEGSKQFTAPPSVPTPLQVADAVNKGYVDQAVAAVGVGSYVSKTGDVMSGALTLAFDPTAPNHAATRHYVDIGLAGKASLVAGLVPGSQLGTGTADGTRCLKGDQTWGECSAASATETDNYTPGGGTKTITGNLHVTQDVSVEGQLSVSGPYQVESDLPATALTAAAANKSKIGFDADGKLKVSENASAPTEVAKRGAIDGSDVASVNKQGNGTKFTMAAGAFTAGNLRSTDANGNAVDSGAASPPYAIPWLTVPRTGSVNGVSFPSTANRAALWGVVLTFPVTTTRVAYSVGTADTNANTYDIGIYDNSGNLRAHIGSTAASTFAGTTGPHQLDWTSAVTLQPGKYYLAITSSCTASCAQLAADNGSGVTFLNNSWVTVASGGSLNGPISPPSDSWVFSSYIPAWGVN